MNEKSPIITQEQLNQMDEESLRKLCAIMAGQIEKKENQIRILDEKVHELEFMNALLNDKLTIAQRKRFGASSEKMADGYEQLNLFNEAEENADKTAPEPQYEEVHAHKRQKPRNKKDTDLSEFEVESVEYKLEGAARYCECGHKYKVVTKEVHKYLEFIPAQFIRKEEIVWVYSCPECNKMVRTEHEPSLLRGSIATPSLVAAIMNAKYVNSIPLNRLSQEFKRYGLQLSTTTMSNWMIRCAEDYLYLIYDEMKKVMLKGHYTHCDETRIQVLDEPDQKSETKNWMWVYMTDAMSDSPMMTLFQYERTRAGYHPKTFLDKYEGYLTTDGYQSYHGLSKSIIVTGCFAHARRRFDQCLTALKKTLTENEWKKSVAYEAMQKIGELYKIEERIRNLSIEERYHVRQEEAKPLLEAYFAWLHNLNDGTLDSKSLIGDAIMYSIRQEEYLRRYLEDGHLAIDNNDCERCQKGFAIGRRNWLFSKSVEGAQASAIIYSLTETAKLNQLKPYTYLSCVLDLMRKSQKETDYSFVKELLPWSDTMQKLCGTTNQK